MFRSIRLDLPTPQGIKPARRVNLTYFGSVILKVRFSSRPAAVIVVPHAHFAW